MSRVQHGWCDALAEDLDEALARCRAAQSRGDPYAVALIGNAAEVYTELARLSACRWVSGPPAMST